MQNLFFRRKFCYQPHQSAILFFQFLQPPIFLANHVRIARGVGACYRHPLDVAWSTGPKPTFRSLGRF